MILGKNIHYGFGKEPIFNGADFYRLPRNTSQITLAKMNWQVPDSYGENGNFITPLKAGENLSWKLIPSS